MNSKGKDLKKYYSQADDIAIYYDSFGPRTKHIKEALSHLDKKNPNTLEIGCAYGRDAKVILEYTNNYLGIDYSPEMISLAQKRLPDANFKIADMQTYKFPNDLDLIISFASLVHSNKKEVKNIINKAYEALNKDGIFYIATWYGAYKKGFGMINSELGFSTITPRKKWQIWLVTLRLSKSIKKSVTLEHG